MKDIAIVLTLLHWGFPLFPHLKITPTTSKSQRHPTALPGAEQQMRKPSEKQRASILSEFSKVFH